VYHPKWLANPVLVKKVGNEECVLTICWRSLMSILYLQLMHNIMVKGLWVHSCRVYSDKFHELCCSHIFCRIIDISSHKSISNDKTEHTIVKILSRRSKRTYHLLYLESRQESPRWICLGIL
jgi:hypothetical protein